MQKSVLITGAAGGIGTSLTAAFKEAGWYVFASDIESTPKANPNIDEFILVDLADPHSVDTLYERVLTSKPSLEALVNNAAVQSNCSLERLSLAEWDRVMAINLRAPCFLTKIFTELLGRQGGAVVNISSVHALHTTQKISAYAAAKGGLEAFTRAAAIELASLNIRVNAIRPGAIDTDMLREGFRRGQHGQQDESECINILSAKHPLKRIGQPREIAEIALFLSEPEKSGFITGQVLTVDGGATARLSTE